MPFPTKHKVPRATYIHKRQDEALRPLSKFYLIPMAAIIRHGVKLVLEKYAEEK